MTSGDPTPTLLAGRSAFGWQRVVEIVGYISVPVFVLCLLAVIFAERGTGFHGAFGVGIGCVGVLMVANLIVLVRYDRRLKAEASAGYTTSWRSQPTLPQLDPSTGELIRKAGDAYLRRSDWVQRNREDARSPSSARPQSTSGWRRPSFWSTAVRWLPFLVVVGAMFGGLFGAEFDRSDLVLGITGWAIVAMALVVIFVGSCALVVRGRLRRMTVAAPSAFTFVFGNSKDYTEGVMTLAQAIPRWSVNMARGASADATGVSIWHGNPPNVVAHLPWNRVTSIQADGVPGSNNSKDLLVLISFKDQFGDLATLSLAYPKVTSFPIPSKADVRWIIQQLTTIREGAKPVRSRAT
jgi:hypothetical protein